MSSKAHPCLGGPLDGEHATSGDFYGYYEKHPGTKRNDYSKRIEGMYEHLKNDYYQFNTGNHGGAVCDVVWLHDSVLRPSISPSLR